MDWMRVGLGIVGVDEERGDDERASTRPGEGGLGRVEGRARCRVSIRAVFPEAAPPG